MFHMEWQEWKEFRLNHEIYIGMWEHSQGWHLIKRREKTYTFMVKEEKLITEFTGEKLRNKGKWTSKC